VDNSISSVFHIGSFGSTWSTSLEIQKQPLVVPNINNNTTKNFIYLEGEVYYDGITSSAKPFYLKNKNTSTIQTRISRSESSTNNTYKIFSSTSVGKHIKKTGLTPIKKIISK
jgi:hypothetical protein